jgi:hypothetical protein
MEGSTFSQIVHITCTHPLIMSLMIKHPLPESVSLLISSDVPRPSTLNQPLVDNECMPRAHIHPCHAKRAMMPSLPRLVRVSDE